MSGPPPVIPPNDAPRPATAKIDANDDGHVSYQELEAGFKAIDKDGNEFLDAKEIEEAKNEGLFFDEKYRNMGVKMEEGLSLDFIQKQIEKKKRSEAAVKDLKINPDIQKKYAGKPSYHHLDDTLTTICAAAHEKDEEMAYEDYKQHRRNGDSAMRITTFKRFIAAQMREEEIKRLGREFIIYLIFISLLCVMMIGNAQIPVGAEISMAIKAAVLEEQYDADDSHVPKTFADIMNVADLWAFINGPLIGGISSSTFYEVGGIAVEKTSEEMKAIYRHNKLAGPIRMRQLRVRKCGDGPGVESWYNTGDCKADNIGSTGTPSYCETDVELYQRKDHFLSHAINDTYSDFCYPGYMLSKTNNMASIYLGDASTDSRENYGTNNQYVYEESNVPKRYGSVAQYGIGMGIKYPAGGFIHDFKPSNITNWGVQVQELMAGKWMDWQTRVVFIDFSTYNPAYNIICQVHITVEFAATGYTYKMVEVQLFQLYTDSDHGYSWERELFWVIILLTAALTLDFIEQGYQKLKLWLYRRRVRNTLWPLVFIHAKRSELKGITHADHDEFPANVLIPPSWNLERLKYCTAHQWWQAAWTGISEIKVPLFGEWAFMPTYKLADRSQTNAQIIDHTQPTMVADKHQWAKNNYAQIKTAQHHMEDCRRVRKEFRETLMPLSIRDDTDGQDHEADQDKKAEQRKAKMRLRDFDVSKALKNSKFCPNPSGEFYQTGQVTDETLYGNPWDIFFFVDALNYLLIFNWARMYYKQSTAIRDLSINIQSDTYLTVIEQIAHDEMWVNLWGALSIGLTAIKAFKFFRLHPGITLFWRMFAFAAPALIAFIMFLLICFMAFGLMGMVWFGKQGKAFNSVWLFFSTELNMLVGDGMGYEDFLSLHRFTGQWFYWLFVVFVVLILMNTFIAILNNAYDSAEEEAAQHYTSAERDTTMIAFIIKLFWSVIGGFKIFKTIQAGNEGTRISLFNMKQECEWHTIFSYIAQIIYGTYRMMLLNFTPERLVAQTKSDKELGIDGTLQKIMYFVKMICCSGTDDVKKQMDTGNLSMANEVFMWRIELAEACALLVNLMGEPEDEMFIWKSQAENILLNGARSLRQRHNIMQFVAKDCFQNLETFKSADKIGTDTASEDPPNWSGDDGIFEGDGKTGSEVRDLCIDRDLMPCCVTRDHDLLTHPARDTKREDYNAFVSFGAKEVKAFKNPHKFSKVIEVGDYVVSRDVSKFQERNMTRRLNVVERKGLKPGRIAVVLAKREAVLLPEDAARTAATPEKGSESYEAAVKVFEYFLGVPKGFDDPTSPEEAKLNPSSINTLNSHTVAYGGKSPAEYWGEHSRDYVPTPIPVEYAHYNSVAEPGVTPLRRSAWVHDKQKDKDNGEINVSKFYDSELVHAAVDFTDLGWSLYKDDTAEPERNLRKYLESMEHTADLMWIDGAYRTQEIQDSKQRLDPFASMSIYEKTISDFYEEVDNGEVEEGIDKKPIDEQKAYICTNHDVIEFFKELTHIMCMLRFTVYTSKIDEWEGPGGFISLLYGVKEVFYEEWMMSHVRRALKMGHGVFLMMKTFASYLFGFCCACFCKKDNDEIRNDPNGNKVHPEGGSVDTMNEEQMDNHVDNERMKAGGGETSGYTHEQAEDDYDKQLFEKFYQVSEKDRGKPRYLVTELPRLSYPCLEGKSEAWDNARCGSSLLGSTLHLLREKLLLLDAFQSSDGSEEEADEEDIAELMARLEAYHKKHGA